MSSSSNQNLVKTLPKYSYSFQKLFQNDKNKKLLIDFLNKTLELDNENEIVNLYFCDSENVPERDSENDSDNVPESDSENDSDNAEDFYLGKRNRKRNQIKNKMFLKKRIRKMIQAKRIIQEKCKWDENIPFYDPFFAVTRNNELLNITIHFLQKSYGDLSRRSWYYISNIIYHSSLSCDDVLTTIGIFFLNYYEFDKNDNFHKNFELLPDIKDKSQMRILNNIRPPLSIHFFELEKFQGLSQKEKEQEKNLWLHFITDPNNEIFLNNKNKSLFTKARKALLSLEKDPNYCSEYENQMEQIKKGKEEENKNELKEEKKEKKGKNKKGK